MNLQMLLALIRSLVQQPQSDPQRQAFLNWYQQYAKQRGMNPNPFAKEQFYDTYGAYQAGYRPSAATNWHWPSLFKTPDSPERMVPQPGGLMLDSLYGNTFQPVPPKDKSTVTP